VTIPFPRLSRVLVPVLVGLAGAWLGIQAFGGGSATLGPFQVGLHANFGAGETDLSFPPLGRITAATHLAPLHLTATVEGVAIQQLSEAVSVSGLERLVQQVEEEAHRQVVLYSIRLLAVAVLGGAVLGLLVFRLQWRRVVVAALSALLVVGATEVATWATYDTSAFLSPTFSGSLSIAPKLIGPVAEASAHIDAFRSALEQIVSGSARVYTSIQSSPPAGPDTIKVLHISDIHLSPLGFRFAQEVAQGFGVDFVIDTGDITNYGTPAENFVTNYIPAFHVPYVFVRGNHDSPSLAHAMSGVPNVRVLNGTTTTVDGITIYGYPDPVFNNDNHGIDTQQFTQQVETADPIVARQVAVLPRPPDVVAVHDDRMAQSLAGQVPLVLSGHFHVPAKTITDGTLYLQNGSTGGAGIKVFTNLGGPLSAEVLYFRPPTSSQRTKLIAYDLISQSPETGSLTVKRQLVPASLHPVPPSASETPSPSTFATPTP
jgi:predicted MPP superfamily phosphohydrolase